MARWDQILSLPVQNPPTLEFSSNDLVWSKVEGWRDNLDKVCLIPFARVDDFVRGESANKDCPTRFHVEARRRRHPQTSCKPKVDGVLEYILYWCSFGPDDHREGGIVRPSRTTYVPKKKSAGRPNTKRGCTCHFIVKRLSAEPTVALIIYVQDKHVDRMGLPCHGPRDKQAAGTRAMYAPYISEDLRLRVLSLLYVGVSVETIMQRHNESVEKQGGPSNRDDLLTHRYVRRQERSIRRSSFELDTDDSVSVSMWVESHQNCIFFYQDFSDTDPFVLGIQTEWQLQQMIRFGNRSLLASDSKFGTNKLKYPIHSLVVFNSDNKAIPVAWIIAPRFSSEDSYRWMRALFNRVQMKDPAWKLAGFIVDDPLADILSIREVFQCSVLICFWRVRHSWHKNLMKRCSEIEMRAGIARKLGQAVHTICRGVGSLKTFEDIMEDTGDAGDFVEYFNAVWFPRLGTWIKALKNLPLASQESSSAMEFYHNQMRLRLMNEKDPNVYERADWLVDKLGTKVHSYFWLDEYSGKDDFARYRKDEWLSGLTAWRKSLKIPDTNVVMEGECVKVVDQEDQDVVHVIWNPGSEFAICDCNWASKGNLCEHGIKTIRFYRQKGYTMPSVSMFQYNQALVDMLHCPPYDSLIRDHAVSLAVWVEKLLNSQIGQENRMCKANPETEQAMGSHDRNLANDFPYRNGLSELENGFASWIKGCSMDNRRVSLGNHMVDDSHTCNEAEVGQACVEMQIDPSSISNSITQSLSVNGSAITDSLAQNRDTILVNVDQDLTKNLPSTHADLSSEPIRDTEMESADAPSLITSSDQFTKRHQNGVSSSNDGSSPCASKAIELLNMVHSSDGENGGLGREQSATKQNTPASEDHTLMVDSISDHIHPSTDDLKIADTAEAPDATENIARTDLGNRDTILTPSMDSPVDIIN